MKPNIIHILTDDLGWRDISCMGSKFYETQNLDSLAARGIRYENAYASCPVCSPSRASFLTGQYPARIGITDWINHFEGHPAHGKLVDAPYEKHLQEGSITIAQRLREIGYSTSHIGKWHLGMPPFEPEKYGFDVNIGGSFWGHPKHGYFSPYRIPNLADHVEGEYLTDRLTDEAINRIKQCDGRPFFMNLCYYAVHTPIQAKADDIEYFQKKAKKLGLDAVNPFVPGEFHPTKQKENIRVVRRIVQSDVTYAAMIKNLDWNVGRLLQTLDQYRLTENTLIIFTSDNGGLATSEGSPTSNLPASEGKGWMYEGGTRIPLLMSYPGKIMPGLVSKDPVITPDLFPTFLAVAGMPCTDLVDGLDLSPTFCGEALPQRPLLWHYPHYGNQGGTPGSSIRLGEFKMIHFYEDDRIELYDLDSDPEEKWDLSAMMPEKVAEMRKLLSSWCADVDAKYPTRYIKPSCLSHETVD